MHQVVYFLELAQTYELVWGVDETTAEEIDGLGGVFAVSDVGTFDRLHASYGFEDGGTEVCTSWKTYGNDGTAGPDVLFDG